MFRIDAQSGQLSHEQDLEFLCGRWRGGYISVDRADITPPVATAARAQDHGRAEDEGRADGHPDAGGGCIAYLLLDSHANSMSRPAFPLAVNRYTKWSEGYIYCPRRKRRGYHLLIFVSLG